MLSLYDIRLSFLRYDTGLAARKLPVLHGLDLEVGRGELVAVVGASGAGKSLLAHAVLGILPVNARLSGDMFFKDTPLTPARQQAVRGREIALIPQSVTYLDPLQRIGAQVRRAAVLSGADRKTAARRQRQAFKRYNLSSSVARHYPHQLSGGMIRRVLLATATVGQADLLIADEPTPGLHPEVAEESFAHLRELADSGRGVLLITHELEGVRKVADRIAVFYAGSILESAPAKDFTGKGSHLRHPYSRALWQALPHNGFTALPGSQPMAGAVTAGCSFCDRCPHATEVCTGQIPTFRELRQGSVRCHHA